MITKTTTVGMTDEQWHDERRKALAFSSEIARQERTIDDLRQQLSFMQQAMQDAGV